MSIHNIWDDFDNTMNNITNDMDNLGSNMMDDERRVREVENSSKRMTDAIFQPQPLEGVSFIDGNYWWEDGPF